MRFAISILISLLSLNVYPQQLNEPVQSSINGNSFYSITNKSNKKVLIFLHGGINNPYFDQVTDKIDFSKLIENNISFAK